MKILLAVLGLALLGAGVVIVRRASRAEFWK